MSYSDSDGGMSGFGACASECDAFDNAADCMDSDVYASDGYASDGYASGYESGGYASGCGAVSDDTGEYQSGNRSLDGSITTLHSNSVGSVFDDADGIDSFFGGVDMAHAVNWEYDDEGAFFDHAFGDHFVDLLDDIGSQDGRDESTWFGMPLIEQLDGEFDGHPNDMDIMSGDEEPYLADLGDALGDAFDGDAFDGDAFDGDAFEDVYEDAFEEAPGHFFADNWDDIRQDIADDIMENMELLGNADHENMDLLDWEDDLMSEIETVVVDYEDHPYYLRQHYRCVPSVLPTREVRVLDPGEARWDSAHGRNGPAMNNLGCVDGRYFIASQSKILAYENNVRVAEKYMPARINNLISGNGPLGASIAVTCDNGQVFLLKAKPLEIVFTWSNQAHPAWGLAMNTRTVATGSNDHNVRVACSVTPPIIPPPTDGSAPPFYADSTARMPSAWRIFAGHTGNLPCVCVWDNHVLSGGLDGSLALWSFDKDSPIATNHNFVALWGCTRIPYSSLQLFEGTAKRHTFPSRALEFADIPPNVMRYDVLPFLTHEELLTVGKVKSHWVNIVDEEMRSPHRRESAFLCLTDNEAVLLDEELIIRQEASCLIDVPDTFAFAVISTLDKNRLFIARKTNCVLQVSLFRLFNSLAIGMRVDPVTELGASYGVCITDETLHGITAEGNLWRASLNIPTERGA